MIWTTALHILQSPHRMPIENSLFHKYHRGNLVPCFTRHPICLMQLQKSDCVPKEGSNLPVTGWHCPADRLGVAGS